MDFKIIDLTSIPLYLTLLLGGAFFLFNRQKGDGFQKFGLIFLVFIVVGMLGDFLYFLIIKEVLDLNWLGMIGVIFSILKSVIWILLFLTLFKYSKHQTFPDK